MRKVNLIQGWVLCNVLLKAAIAEGSQGQSWWREDHSGLHQHVQTSNCPPFPHFPLCLQVPGSAAASHPCSQPGVLLLAVFLQLLHFGAAAKVQGGLKPDISKILLPVWWAVCHIALKHFHLSDIQMSLVVGEHWCVCPQAGRWKVSNQHYPASLLV